jgi:23S rRNA (uracil1939-C5)-methyltransferase
MRVAAGSGQVGVVLVVRSLDAYDWALMAAELTSIEGLTGVWLNENDTEGNSVLGARTVHLSGSRRLGDKIAGQLIERNPMTFFQTNHRATEKLVAAVGELLPAKMSDLFDVYAGGGMFSVAVGKRTERLHLVESHPDAVAAARATLQAANLPAEIHLGRAENILPSLVEDGAAADAMIIDPPRSGVAPEALAAIIKMAPSRIVYVSCQMRSLLRDLCALSEGGYSLEEVRAVDMFPHTPHIETVSLLTQ